MNSNDKSPYYTIKNLKRFDQRDNIFGRMKYDKNADFYKMGIYDNINKIITNDNKGYSNLDYAKVMSSWTVYDYFHNAFSWDKLSDANSVMEKPKLKKFAVKDKISMTEQIKKISNKFGATKVGITEINPLWIYSNDLDGSKINIPKDCKYAIVLAVKMDPSLIKESPNFIACAETGLVYSKMAFCISCVAEYIRYLGYKAIPMGNDTALSIPLAIDAGLGELGRHGLLITKKYGPCVRLCKIFTDLPMAVDKPIEFGVRRFCENCRNCAESCEADAIQFEKKPSFKAPSKSNSKGVLRWAVDHEKCYKFWIKNGGDCSNCIAACPYFPTF
jgi:reductive dehalogenase